MRVVTWTDGAGFRHRSVVRDSDPDSMADRGIKQDPPDLRALDWEGVIRDLHNHFVDEGITDWYTYQRKDSRMAILKSMQRRIQALFREVEND